VLSQLQPTICIVGSGPSGCYLAQFLIKQWPEAQISIVDRLDHPYGLALYGVAPDHHGTRAVTKQFDRLWSNPNVQFVPNVEVGVDVSLAELQANFDIVVLATGLHQDRKLSIEGDGLPGVVGAGRVTRLINGHPNETADDFSIGQNLLIVGQGNVAIDIVRLTLTSPDKLHGIGVPANIIEAIHSTPIRRISIVGRSTCSQAKFDVAMVRELANLTNVSFSASRLESVSKGDASDPKEAAIHDLVANSLAGAQRNVDFHFGWQPTAIAGSAEVSSVTFSNISRPEETLIFDTDTVITAIGFEESDDASIRRNQLKDSNSNIDVGLLSAGLYCVGWFRRGPTGTIPANRVDAKMVSDSIIQDFQNRDDLGFKKGRHAIKQLQSASKS
jgi:ferredoxin--NADP+ reductase